MRWRLALAVCVIGGVFALAVGRAQMLASVVTDKSDYRPGETVQITGNGFGPQEVVTLQVTHVDPDEGGETGSGHDPWTVSTDAQGHFESTWYVNPDDSVGATFLLTAASATASAQTTFTDAAAATLQQCRNGAALSPNNCEELGGGTGWVSGNAGRQTSHYVEGFSIPYRAKMTELPVGSSISIDLGYDIKHSGAHAIDFLTHYQRLESHAGFGHSAETVAPLSGITGVSATVTNFPIPPPSTAGTPVPGQPATRFNALPLAQKVMTLFGGTITGVAYVTQGSLTASQSETVIRVTFTPDSATAVLAWGGHIARAADWGQGNSAGGINGSPYHMRLKDWRCEDNAANTQCDQDLGNLGNQDRSLSADAVFPTGTVIITKQIVDDGGNNTFSFTDTGLTLTGGFSLTTTDPDKNATQIFTEVLAGRATSVTESTPPTGWVFDSLVCTDPDSGTTISGQAATIDLDANETVSCTFRNREDFSVTRGKIIVRKVTDPSSDTTTVFDFTKSYGSSAFTLRNGESDNSGFIEPGTYSVGEVNVPTGWSLTNSACDDGSDPSSISLAAGETVTCTFTNTKNGTIIVDKVTNPSGDSQSFSFTTTGTGYTGFTLTDAQAPNSQSVVPGSYAVSESTQAGWDLTSAVCDQGETPESLDVGPGETVTCTFTNTKRAVIIIDKVTVPSGESQQFTFNPSYGGGPFQLADATAPNNSGQLAPGSYTVEESAQAGWALTNIACSDPTGNSSGDVATRRATISLAAGETVTCTFTNTKPDARITLTPATATNPINEQHVITALVQQNAGAGFVAAPDGTLVTFSLLNNTASASFVGGNTCTTAGGTGQCTVTINGTQAGSVDIRGTTTLSVLGVSLTRTTGDGISGDSADAKKTYVSGTIIIDKVTVPGGEAQLFTFTPSYNSGGTFQLADGTAPHNSGQLAPGSYTVTESTQTGWALTNIACTDPTGNSSGDLGTRQATINLAAGETVTCTFTNTKPDARITLTPGTATNPINEKHVITALVQQNTGSGFVAAPDGTLVTFSLLNNTASASFVGGVNTCTTTAGTGQCTVTINASQAGNVDIRGTTTLSVLGVSLTRTTGDGISGDSPDANKQYVSGRIIIDKVTAPIGDAQLFTFTPSYNGGATFQLADGTTPNDSGQLAPGTYSVSEAVLTGWDLTSATCSDGSQVNAITLSAGETVTCTFNNRKRGNIILEKQTNPNGATGTFEFTGAIAGSIGDNGQIVVSNVVPGEYFSTETNPAPNFDLALIQCDDGNSTGNLGTRTVAFNVEPGETVKCVFTNNQRGMVEVKKITNGAVHPELDIKFTLYETSGNPLKIDGDPQLETLSTLGDVDGILAFTTKLTAGKTYTVCENPVPAGWTSLWMIGFELNGEIVTPYNPSALDTPPADLGVRCFNFTVEPAQTAQFEVHNDFPGGDPRTIGYWKNWNRCTNGGQARNADLNGGAAAGFYLLENVLPQLIGDFSVDTCQKGVYVLGKQDQTGRNRASDAAYELASQFLATRANLAVGAQACSAVSAAVVSAQMLLDSINFTGSGAYLPSNVRTPELQTLRTQALALAATLDQYNNGNLCTP